jgi:hypothetical protein
MKFGVIAAAFAGYVVTTWLIYRVGLVGVVTPSCP